MLNTLSHSAIAFIKSSCSFQWPAMLANALELSGARVISCLRGPSLFIKFQNSCVDLFNQCLAVPKPDSHQICVSLRVHAEAPFQSRPSSLLATSEPSTARCPRLQPSRPSSLSYDVLVYSRPPASLTKQKYEEQSPRSYIHHIYPPASSSVLFAVPARADRSSHSSSTLPMPLTERRMSSTRNTFRCELYWQR